MSGADQERDDDDVLAAEHVLGLLAPAEEAAFAARIEADAELRARVARWTESFAHLAAEVPEAAPPRGVEAALLRRLFPERRRGLLARFGLLPAVMAGLAVAIVALFLVLPSLRGPTEPALAARIEAEDGSLVVAAAYDAEAGLLRIERVAGGVAPGRAQELWLVAGDEPPASLGVLPEGAEGEVAVPESLRAGLHGGTLAISDEPPGGSATGVPGPVIAAGAVTEL